MSNTEKVKEFYTNDIVYRFDKHKRVVFGVVVNSINSYEASPDVDEYQALQKGQIRVLWSNTSREQVWKQNKVRLMNRNIIPGDIVRRLEKGKETQRGYCKEATQVATVQIVGTDKVIEHISDDRLHNVRPYAIDDAVCLGNKFGRIEGVDQMISMQSKCGSIVQVLTSINHELDDYWLSKRNRLSYEPFYQYYPGQELVCIPSSLEQAHWIKKTRTMKRNMQARQRFTVQSVEDVLIEIAWYTNSSGYAHLAEIPPEDIKKLKVLEHPSDNFLELSDRRLFKLSAADVLLKKKDWIRKLSLMYRADVSKMRYVIYSNPRLPKVRSASLAYPSLEPSLVAPVTPSETEERTEKEEEEKVEIDGEEEEEEEWWTEEAEESDDGNSSSARIAYSPSPRKRHYPPKARDLVPGHTLPVEVICVESKVTVVWQDGTEEKDIPSTQLYYSISLDDHEFFPGEWVVSDNAKEESDKYGVVQSVNYLERTAKIKWFTYSETKKVPEELAINEMSVYDLKKHSKFVFRPRSIVKSKPDQNEKLGKVIDSCIEGYVKVKWIDSLEEQCWPQDIELIPDTDDYSFSDEESTADEAAAGGSSWETESMESYAGDLSDETAMQNVAARLDFVRNRVVFMREAFKQHTISENFSFLKDLLLVYENSSYLDKLLGTAFFSLKSKHFQALLHQAKEKAKSLGVDLRGRLFSSDSTCPSISRIKVAEKENMSKVIRLENRINAQIEKKEGKEPVAPTTPLTPDSTEVPYISQENLCVELLSMLKIRMDLAYAEIISRIGGPQAFSVLTKASEQVAPTPFSSTPVPSCPTTPDDSFSALSPWRAETGAEVGGNEPYASVEDAPRSHHYYGAKFEPTDLQRFLKAVQREYKLLKESLPSGVWVRSYGNRIDLLSVMIEGPANTPYEDGLFLFDIQLSIDYPRSPPLVHYISYSTERLNPNLYVEGKVCVSLLGTWMGRGTEVWGPDSTLLQLIVSIQGLILVAEPYYNEAGYEKQNETQQGIENSRTYNELVILKLVQSMKELLRSPPEVFKAEIFAHFAQKGQKLCDRLNRFCNENDTLTPDFALLPVSKGLKLSLSSALAAFREVLAKIGEKSGDTNKESI